MTKNEFLPFRQTNVAPFVKRSHFILFPAFIVCHFEYSTMRVQDHAYFLDIYIFFYNSKFVLQQTNEINQKLSKFKIFRLLFLVQSRASRWKPLMKKLTSATNVCTLNRNVKWKEFNAVAVFPFHWCGTFCGRQRFSHGATKKNTNWTFKYFTSYTLESNQRRCATCISRNCLCMVHVHAQYAVWSITKSDPF